MEIVTPENCPEAEGAVREILLLYVNMAEGYGGFGHAVDCNVRLDPLRFVDAEMDTRGGGALVDLDLLRTGSAIAALCFLYDWWLEVQAVDNWQTQDIKQALVEGRFRHVPDVEAVITEAFRRDLMPLDDPWFDAAVAPIYRRHVAGFFKRLAVCDRYPRDVT